MPPGAKVLWAAVFLPPHSSRHKDTFNMFLRTLGLPLRRRIPFFPGYGGVF
jgi:hypothetical protein